MMLLTFDRKFNMITIYSIYWRQIMENTRPFHITKAEDQIMNILWSVKGAIISATNCDGGI